MNTGQEPTDAANRRSTERLMCVVIHDVAPATQAACERLLSALHAIGDIPVTLLAVPRYHGGEREPAFERWLRGRADAGDEVALHGYTHLDSSATRGGFDFIRRRIYTRGEGEFWGLSENDATRRIQAGSAWLASLGLAPTGFVAPAWLLGAPAWAALLRQPFDYTCTLRRFTILPENRSIDCQAQVYSHSTAWRRALSLLWNATLARLQSGRAVVRLELHPGDADHPALQRSWQRLAARQLASRRVCLLRELATIVRTGRVTTDGVMTGDVKTAPAPTVR